MQFRHRCPLVTGFTVLNKDWSYFSVLKIDLTYFSVLNTEVEYQRTKTEAERAEKLATQVRSESLSIYSDVKLLTIPDIDTSKLYDQADEIKYEVKALIIFYNGNIQTFSIH